MLIPHYNPRRWYLYQPHTPSCASEVKSILTHGYSTDVSSVRQAIGQAQDAIGCLRVCGLTRCRRKRQEEARVELGWTLKRLTGSQRQPLTGYRASTSLFPRCNGLRTCGFRHDTLSSFDCSPVDFTTAADRSPNHVGAYTINTTPTLYVHSRPLSLSNASVILVKSGSGRGDGSYS